MAKFCHECGNPIIDSNSLFCPKCGAKLPIISSEVQPPEKSQKSESKKQWLYNFLGLKEDSDTKNVEFRFGIDIIDNTLNRLEKDKPSTESTTKKRSAGEWIAICCGGIILLFIIAAVISGISGNYGSSTSKDVIITKDLSLMALTINDLPTGWKTYGTPEITPNIYNSNFVKVEMLTPYVVYLNITRYPTVERAKAEYYLEKAEITQFKVESVNLGNEGFGYVNDDSSIVIFRAGNIITTTQYGVGGFGASSSFLSISDAEKYAKIVEGRML